MLPYLHKLTVYFKKIQSQIIFVFKDPKEIIRKGVKRC